MPLLSIIIVNYNGEKFLKDCLNSIRNKISCSYEVILVDNASTDNSCEYIKQNFLWVKFIESKINTGFTGGNNIGALQAKGEYLLLLNNDTLVLSDITPAMQILQNDKKIGVVGCKLLYPDKTTQASFGYEHTPLRLILSWLGVGKYIQAKIFNRMEPADSILYNQYQDNVSWVSGACLITRKNIWDTLNGLDMTYFMYIEDVDYCKRVHDLGYHICYTPSVEIIHYEGGGKPWVGERALLNTTKSYCIYTKKFHGLLPLLFVKLFLSIIMFFRGLFFYVLYFYKKQTLNKEKGNAFIKASYKIYQY